jgi:hypothetical protein
MSKREVCEGSKRLTALVRDHGEINVFLWPSQAILNPPKALKLHRQLALRNFIIWEHLRNNASVHFFTHTGNVSDRPSDETPIRFWRKTR